MGGDSGEELYEQTIEKSNVSLKPLDRISESNKPHACNVEGCSARFSRPYRLEQHLRVHSGERPFTCMHPGCEKSYTNKAHLSRHVASNHSKEFKKSFKCQFPGCGLSISHESNLRRHYLRAHKPQLSAKAFSCSQCPQSFSKHRQLLAHSYEHTGIPPFRCDLCSSGFLREAQLNRHKRTHCKYECDSPDCMEKGVVFERWSELLRHRRLMHARTFSCAICDRTFPGKIRLKNHMNIHLEERGVFACPHSGCPRYYYYQKNLKDHVKRNHEGRQHKCPVESCGKSLCSRTKLAKHMKLHKPDYIPRRTVKSGADRQRRKDIGQRSRSMAATLSGARVPRAIEKAAIKSGDIVKCFDKTKNIPLKLIEETFKPVINDCSEIKTAPPLNMLNSISKVEPGCSKDNQSFIDIKCLEVDDLQLEMKSRDVKELSQILLCSTEPAQSNETSSLLQTVALLEADVMDQINSPASINNAHTFEDHPPQVHGMSEILSSTKDYSLPCSETTEEISLAMLEKMSPDASISVVIKDASSEEPSYRPD